MALTSTNAAGQTIDKFSGNLATPSQVSNSISQGISGVGHAYTAGDNPKDAPGYVPGSSSTDRLDTSTSGQAVDTSQPTVPTPTTQPASPVAPTNSLTTTQPSQPSGLPGMPDLTGTQSQQAGQAIDQLKQKYGKALTDILGTGVASPSNAGSATAGINTALATQPAPPPPTPPAINSFLDPATNPVIDEQTQALRELLSPASDRVALQNSIDQLQTDRSSLNGIKTELLNVKNIMAGTQQDIADEVTKAGGTVTESLLANMTIARNRTLIQQSQQLTDQLQTMTDLVNSDTSLVTDEKQMAQQQFANNMSILNYQQTNYNNQLNAARSSIDTLIKTPGGLAAYAADPVYASRAEQIMGYAPGTITQLNAAAVKEANTKATSDALDQQYKKAEISKIYSDMSGNGTGISGNTTINTPSGTKNVPTALAPYVQTAYDGTPYADLSSLTPSDKAKYAQIAQSSGIKPILDTGTAGKLNNISVSKENLQNIMGSITSANILNDKEIPSSQGFGNSIKSALGNSNIRSFNAWRTAIINNVQALAGGAGSGLRINKSEIDSAMQNDLPVITGVHADNLSTAKAKIDKLNSQLDTWNKQILGGGNTANTHIPPVGTVIQQGGKSYHVVDTQGNLQPI